MTWIMRTRSFSRKFMIDSKLSLFIFIQIRSIHPFPFPFLISPLYISLPYPPPSSSSFLLLLPASILFMHLSNFSCSLFVLLSEGCPKGDHLFFFHYSEQKHQITLREGIRIPSLIFFSVPPL